MNSNYKKILAEVLKAYADCGDMPFKEAMKIRNLSFRASSPVTRDEAVSIFTAAVPSYNNFTPDLLRRLPEGASITIAREGSVCIYVDKKLLPDTQDVLKADEMHWENKETRIWWD